MTQLQINSSFVLQIRTSQGVAVTKPFESVSEAKEILNKTIYHCDISVSNWHDAQIYHPTKGVVAHLSYNGKIWDGEDKGFDGYPYKEILNLIL